MEISKTEQAPGRAILIVDDNPQNLQVLGKLLQERNYEIEFATNGVAALDWIKSRQFDLVLLDINMPEMDGFEVCRRIRAEQDLNNLPVIFLSADNDRESILRGFELGGQDYVTKPFDARELLVRVKTHLSLKESRENLEQLNRSLEEKVKERTLQLKAANEALGIMNVRLTELDAAKTEFLKLVSHEIRTPLNGIMLSVELLKDTASPPEINELVGVLDDSVRRLEKFALNALLITRLKTNPYNLDIEETDLEELLVSVTEMIKNNLEEKQLTLKMTGRSSPGNINCEPGLIRKCILNILENAIEYSPAGGQIEIRTICEDDQISVTVSDCGNGIPSEILEKGGEPFSRGSEYRDRSAGIGLPLAGMIMEAHRGEIKLANKADGGAQVSLVFRR